MSIAVAAGVGIGVWLMGAPALLHYAGSPAGDLHRMAGPIAASLALIAAWQATSAVRWPNVLIGAVLVVSIAVVHHPQPAIVAGVVSGSLLIAATPFARRPRERMKGSWRVVMGAHRGGKTMRKPKVVVVTGASAGVGRAIVREFAAKGYDVALLARNADGLDVAAKEVEAAGRRWRTVELDVADADAVEAAARQVEQDLGPIDVWVNNAMTSVFAEFMAVSPEEFRRVTDVTYHGYVYGTRAALERMLPRDRGVVVQVGSALAYRGIPLQAAYCGAKHAVQGFTESVRCELLHRRSGVRIGMVQLPAVNTPQFDWVLSRLPRRAQPVPPIYQPELIARSVVSFAERPRREMWLGWAAIKAILGNKVAPGVLDRYLGWTGYDAQQTDEPARADRPSNLWQSPGGDWGARGRFDERALTSSPAMWMSRHRRGLTMAGAAVGTLVALRAFRGG